MSLVTRRQLLAAAASAPLAPLALSRDVAAVQAPSQTTTPPPPRYALAANLELMFPQTMPHAQRMDMIAAQGIKAFGFWSSVGKDHKAMLDAQQRLGLACCSITGTTDARFFGLYAGYLLVSLVTRQYTTDVFRFPVVIKPILVVEAVLMMLAFVLAAQLVVFRVIRTLPWLDVLKVRE